MKKGLLFTVLILSCYNVLGFGLIPASYEFNFEPGANHSFSFAPRGLEEDQEVDLYYYGDFEDYISLSENATYGRHGFTVNLSFPQEAIKPGINRLYVGMAERGGASGGFGALMRVEALVKVYVPYPGKYAEGTLYVENVNVGQNISFQIEVDNLGKEDLYLEPEIDLYHGEEKIKTVVMEGQFLTGEARDYRFLKQFNSSEIGAGSYKLQMILDYGTIFKDEMRELKVGSLHIGINNYTREINASKINEFKVEIESFWNTLLENVYVSVNLSNSSSSTEFKTSSTTLFSWEKKVLTGYLNAEKFAPGEYDLNVSVFYSGKFTSESEKITLVQKTEEKKFPLKLVLIISACILGAIFIIFFIWMIWKLNRLSSMVKNGKRKN